MIIFINFERGIEMPLRPTTLCVVRCQPSYGYYEYQLAHYQKYLKTWFDKEDREVSNVEAFCIIEEL